MCKQETVILKKNVTYQALSNNLVVYSKEFTSTHNGNLLECYSLDSTYMSFATTESCLRTHAWSISATNRLKLSTNGLNLGTKRPCVRTDWIPLQRVKCWELYAIKAPPWICFFSKSSFILLIIIIMPLLGEQSNSNGRPYSVSVRALLEFMYIEINRGSFSFYCSHVAPLKKSGLRLSL